MDEKLESLRRLIRSFGSCVVAYSGGVDSAFLAVAAFRELGRRSAAVIADSPSLARRELAEAKAIAKEFQFPLEVVFTKEFAKEDYLSNPTNRCYFCKAELFQKLAAFAKQRGFAIILYGENASDSAEIRPGRAAAEEFAVRAPLREAGLTKAEIRRLSQAMGLPTAEKPAQPCLSSRIPHGERVTPEKLRMIEAGEQAIRRLGIQDLRVRLHEIGSGYLATVEIPKEEWPRLLEANLRERAGNALREAGFRHVTLDVFGYRSGGRSVDTVFPLRKKSDRR